MYAPKATALKTETLTAPTAPFTDKFLPMKEARTKSIKRRMEKDTPSTIHASASSSLKRTTGFRSDNVVSRPSKWLGKLNHII
jgi:hypothetical protein